MRKYLFCILAVCLLTGCRNDLDVLPETAEISIPEETVQEPAGADETAVFLAYYDAAMSVYQWFHWGCDRIGHGEEQIRIGNVPYYTVDDPVFADLGIGTAAELRAYLQTIFTEAFTDELLSREIFADIDGRLHIVGASRGGGAWLEAREFHLVTIDKNRKELVCRAAFYPTGSMEPEEELRAYVFPFVLENDAWLLDDWPAVIRDRE
ncbi:MAG: hypothetical protein II979_07440 [Clostridia bacterium]|nr:hypothetical protein [Clostridia bacterium]